MSMNKVILHGFIGQDPESKVLPSGAVLVKFSLATTETWTDKESKEKKKKTEWHQIAAWGAQADIIMKNMHKGSEIMVVGKIEYSSTGEGTDKKYFTNIRLESFDFCGKKDGSVGGGRPDPEEPGYVSNESNNQDNDDEVPF